MQVLLCAGFADCGETLVLKRSDVGLLYVVAASLQNSIDIVCSRS